MPCKHLKAKTQFGSHMKGWLRKPCNLRNHPDKWRFYTTIKCFRCTRYGFQSHFEHQVAVSFIMFSLFLCILNGKWLSSFHIKYKFNSKSTSIMLFTALSHFVLCWKCFRNLQYSVPVFCNKLLCKIFSICK